MPTRDAANSPARVDLTSNGAGTCTATTAPFSPPDDSRLELTLTVDSPVAGSPVFTPPTGGTGLEWKLRTSQPNGSGGSVAVFTARNATAQTNITITSGATGIGSLPAGNAGSMWLDVWTGCAASQEGAASFTATSATQTNNPALRTTRAGSRIAGGAFEFNANSSWTSSDTIESATQAGIGGMCRAFRAVDSGAADSLVTLNMVSDAATPAITLVVYEILAPASPGFTARESRTRTRTRTRTRGDLAAEINDVRAWFGPSLTVGQWMAEELRPSTGGGDVTAPTVTSSWTWSATAASPRVDTLAPTVSASWAWSASAVTPRIDVVAPTTSASWAWSANASPPLIDAAAPAVIASWAWTANALPAVADPPVVVASWTWQANSVAPIVGVSAPTVQASWAWAANGPTPVIDTIAPAVSASWSWSASSVSPLVDTIAPAANASWAWQATAEAPGDTTTPAVVASWAWSAASQAPSTGVVAVESIGNYGEIGLGPFAPRRSTSWAWRAVAARPIVERPSQPIQRVNVVAPAVVARMAWRAAHEGEPRGAWLRRATPKHFPLSRST